MKRQPIEVVDITSPARKALLLKGRRKFDTFVRRVEPNQTLTKHDFQGMYIIPPGSSFALFFLSPDNEQVNARIAFGWWEEKG